ncbi:hypothetical protein [Flavobacterium psychrophilum]|uniref:hypothetical protein n=1 Tax=Flavobacterium psychrophilum TaxID=96345 RepID=UPI000B7C2F5D|nr:hypothetical protein [Flavobacterium psychrophilum]SNA84062.1 conserved hypothetical protein [Flavobacterium psychrophilum]
MATPRRIAIKTEVKNGKFIENRNEIKQAIEGYEGKRITVTLERYYKKRSNEQNSYYWACIVEHWKNILREEWGEIYQPNEVHEFLKSNLNFKEVVDTETGEVALNPITNEVLRKPKSTTENSTFNQEEYHESCRQLAYSMFQYNIPLPEKKIDVKFN